MVDDKLVTGDTITDEGIDALIQQGDLSQIPTHMRSKFLYKLAEKMGLNPMTKPFDLIMLNNKLTLYANRTCADQLRKNHTITSEVVYAGPLFLGETKREDVYVVHVKLRNPEGREEMAIGSVGIDSLKGEALANAIMKCHTKALRRGTLSFCGLGFLDELEVESVQNMQRRPGAAGQPRQVTVDADPNEKEAETIPEPPPAPTPATSRLPRPTALPKAIPAAKPPVQVKGE